MCGFLSVFVWLMCCWILATCRPRIAALYQAEDAMWRVSLYFIDVSSGGVTATSTDPAPSKTPVKQSSGCASQSTALVQSLSSDSFSALGTLLLDKRVANAHTQWDFPFQAWRWKVLKKLYSYTLSAFNNNVVLWPFISTRSILGEIRKNPQSFHGKEKTFVVQQLSYDKIMEILFLQD